MCVMNVSVHNAHVLLTEVRFHKNLQKLVAVNVSDQTSGIIVCGYVCRILGKNIAYDLIYGVIALFTQSVINNGKVFS